jgi:hypothetical protein
MPSSPVRHVLAGACAAALLLAGCTGGSPDAGATAPAPDLGPLEEYLARVYGWADGDAPSAEDQQAEHDRRQREAEELIAACMREQGFDYVPAAGDGGVVSGVDPEVAWGTAEFAEQYGYGISTDPYGWDDQELPMTEDPNQEYLDAMSDAERDAYWAALWGPPHEADESADGDEWEYDWTRAGCNGAAHHEVWDDDPSDEFAGLQDAMREVWEQIAVDPRVRALDAAWSACMAAAGFGGLDSRDAVYQPLNDEWNRVQGWDDPDYQALLEAWDWAADPDGPGEPDVDPEEVRAFRAHEIATAVADLGCQEEVAYDDGVRQVSHELQREFVDRHRAELDAWVAAATGDA